LTSIENLHHAVSSSSQIDLIFIRVRSSKQG
jgi:hypothetical protein